MTTVQDTGNESATGPGTGQRNAPRGVLFDIDDTLVDTRGAFTIAIGAAAAQFLPHVPVGEHPAAVALWRQDSGGHYRAYTRGELSFREQRLRRANELHAHFGGETLDDARYDSWAEVFDAAFEDATAAFTDALPIVEALLERGVAVGALSNASMSRQSEKLARVGLSEHVPMLVGVDTLGVGKPDPRVFQEACRLLGTEPSETVYVGDELDIDARAALVAGLHGIWLDRPGTRRGGVHLEDRDAAEAEGIDVVDSLEELSVLLGVPEASAL